jgi:protein gp37
MAETKIEWAHFTHNPWIGCTKLSPACDNCYAETQNNHRKWAVGWGPHAPRKRTKTRSLLRLWNKVAAEQDTRKRVFVASLADVGDNHRSIEPEWRRQLVDDIRQCRNLDFLLLTKRPQNMPKLYPDMMEEWPSNAWMGTTVENQVEANRRIPDLFRIPAPVLFLSCEPLLSELVLDDMCDGNKFFDALRGNWWHDSPDGLAATSSGNPKISWVIAGGESGGNARPSHPAWFRSLRDQCKRANVPFFFKQWGEWASVHHGREGDEGVFVSSGRDSVKPSPMVRIGKARAGRTLDGVLHDAFPVLGEAA